MSVEMSSKKSSQVLWFVSSVASLGVGSALALGLINPWTVQDNYKYQDAKYLNAGATVEAVKIGSTTEVSAGSDTETVKSYKVHVTLPAGAGSLSEEAKYVGEIKDTDALPKSLDLKSADKDWMPVGSESEGTLEVKEWDKMSLKGKLFSYPLNAEPVKIKVDKE
jgi:hypothetical protein